MAPVIFPLMGRGSWYEGRLPPAVEAAPEAVEAFLNIPSRVGGGIKCLWALERPVIELGLTVVISRQLFSPPPPPLPFFFSFFLSLN